MKRLIYLSGFFALSVFLFHSCTDPLAVGYDKWNDLKPGANLTFEVEPPSVIGVNTISELNFTGKLLAPTGRVESYDLELYADLNATANIRTDTVLLGTYTSFPLELDFSIDVLADAVGMPVDSVSFGDTFYFIGTVTDDEGNIYYAGTPSLEPVIDTVTNDTTELIFDPAGSINDKYYDPTNGYRDGFLFQFSIGCPENTMDIDALVGSWVITNDPFGAAFDASFEVEKGPGENQITCKDLFSHPEAYDVVLTLDPVTNNITVDKQEAWNSANFGLELGIASVEGNGTMFQCAGFMKLILEHTITLGSYGNWELICEQQ